MRFRRYKLQFCPLKPDFTASLAGSYHSITHHIDYSRLERERELIEGEDYKDFKSGLYLLVQVHVR